MITTSSPEVLRSIIAEAGRQSDFYHRRNDQEIADFWASLEGLAFEAKAKRLTVLITTRGNTETPHSIKACEQGQQLRNHNVIKAFQ